jgi:integrase
MSEFYNESIKSMFLSKFSEQTQKVYARFFKISQSLEQRYDTDLSSFTLEQIEELFYLLNPATETSSRNSGAVLSSYINWCIQERKSLNVSQHPLTNRTSEWYKSFVKPKSELTESELYSLEQRCVNAQDAVILRLIYEGIKGDGCSELVQLRLQDVDIERGIVKLANLDNSKRKLEVSQRTIQLIKAAARESMYEKKNGMVSGTTKSHCTNLVQNEYVIRNSITRNENLGVADKYLIYRRLSMLSEVFEMPNLNVNMIERSGMLKMAKELLDAEGKLEREQYLKIAERFHVSKRMNNGIEEYNYYSLKQFVTVQKVTELYKE